MELQLRNQQEKSESTSHRNCRGLNLDSFRKEFNNNRILNKDNLEEAFAGSKEEMTRAVDEIAPLVDRGKPKRKSRPRFNSQLLEQQKDTRNRESSFNKYREDHHWRAFTGEWKRYNRMLEFSKRQCIITRVNESNNNSRQLFKLVENFLGKKDENPMPPSTSNSQLAEEFMEFFHAKIEKNRERFKLMEPY